MNVAVIGASPKEDRYSFKAQRLLREHGHQVTPVSPVYQQVDGKGTVSSLADLKTGQVSVLTMYVSSDKSSPMADDIIRLAPERVIFNPGSENAALEKTLAEKGIVVLRACTLVLLNTGQF